MKLPLLREPLLQFLVLGAVLFGAFSFIDKKEAEAPAQIVVSAAHIANLADGFARTWRRPPTEQELQDLSDKLGQSETRWQTDRRQLEQELRETQSRLRQVAA